MTIPEILVLDTNRQFVDYAHPAFVRKLLRAKMVSVYSQSPFIIQFSGAKHEYWQIKSVLNKPGEK
jgi:hypothetical protein